MRIKSFLIIYTLLLSFSLRADCVDCIEEKQQGFFASLWSSVSSLWSDTEEVTEVLNEPPPIKVTPLRPSPHPPKARYPQCLEALPDSLAQAECGANMGHNCLIQEDQLFLDQALLAKVEGYDPDGVKECLFYKGTRVIKRPSNEHLVAIARNSDLINEVANQLGIPAVALACSIGADATLTRKVWGTSSERQGLLVHPMIQNAPAIHAIKYLSKKKVKMPSLTEDDWDTERGVIIKTGIILKEAALSYAEHGYDISQSNEVLATLYNIGSFKADGTSKAKGRTVDYRPSPNFFGLYCLRYRQTYSDLLK